MRLVLAGTQALEFRRAEDDEGRYAWIEQVLRRFGYRQLGRSDRGVVLVYLQRLSGYSRAQVTRLVSRYCLVLKKRCYSAALFGSERAVLSGGR